jgi:ABC-type branched-subunit amino acid transport system substrate-binding protein
MRTGITRRSTLTVCVVTLLLAALTFGATSRQSGSTPTQGVTKDSIKIGIALIDFSAIKDFVDYNFGDTKKVAQTFVDYINNNGGIDGRKIIPVYKEYPPIPGGKPDPLSLCTAWAEDDKVFAVLGVFIDFSGQGQLCLAKEHKVVHIGHELDQPWIDAAPGGLLLTPDATKQGVSEDLVNLLASTGRLKGKTVAVLGDKNNAQSVNDVTVPALKKAKAKTGSTAILTITGTDTTAAQAQLDSFIERWKTEHVNALLLIGDDVSSKQFVEKIRRAIPGITLIADTTGVLSGAQDEQKAGVKPNPYDGIITAEGQTGAEHQKTKHGAYCRGIWEKATGRTMPAPNDIVKGPGGKREELYGEVEDGCLFTTMFATIANRVGVNLNSTNWVNAVNNFGPIDDTSTIYASIHAGKYDADDTYGLVAYDPTIPKLGDWRAVTPVQNVGGS